MSVYAIAIISIFTLLHPYSLKAETQSLQILHTNDLHGFLENTIEDKTVGGYARIKSIFDHEKGAAMDQSVETLVLDGGDFFEGNMFYMADRGRSVYNIMNLMGYDAVVMGNHDWLMGTKELDTILGENPPQFNFLGANIDVWKPNLRNIKKFVQPYKIFHFGETSIAVLGLTTDEVFYSWRFTGAKIKKPAKVARYYSDLLKNKYKVDYVIALTHLGIMVDRDIVQNSTNIDLVVGGHSHTVVKEQRFEKNELGRDIPIVQTGSHGEFVGKMMVKLSKEAGLQIDRYELIKVDAEKEKDEEVNRFVLETRKKLNTMYGEAWLKEVVGHTEILLDNSLTRLTPWTKIVTDAIKESVGAVISIHSPTFSGANIPPGPITREDIFNTYPRVFDLDDKYGWKIWKIDLHGVVLKSLIRMAIQGQRALTFSGVTFDMLDKYDIPISLSVDGSTMFTNESDEDWLVGRFLGIDNSFYINNIKVGGKKIRSYRRYRVALVEGIAVGGIGITSLTKKILREMNQTDVTLWQAIEDKIRKIGTIRKTP
jgi:5'-nucleotidase / UDP-sugar diphosphatase